MHARAAAWLVVYLFLAEFAADTAAEAQMGTPSEPRAPSLSGVDARGSVNSVFFLLDH